MKVEKRKV